MVAVSLSVDVVDGEGLYGCAKPSCRWISICACLHSSKISMVDTAPVLRFAGPANDTTCAPNRFSSITLSSRALDMGFVV